MKDKYSPTLRSSLENFMAQDCEKFQVDLIIQDGEE